MRSLEMAFDFRYALHHFLFPNQLPRFEVEAKHFKTMLGSVIHTFNIAILASPKSSLGSPEIAVVMNTLLPTITGQEWPRPSTLVVQTTLIFSLRFQVTGGFCPSAIPVAPGPRNPSQSKGLATLGRVSFTAFAIVCLLAGSHVAGLAVALSAGST